MIKHYGQLITGILIGLFLGLLIGKQVFEKTNTRYINAPSAPATAQEGEPANNRVPAATNDNNNSRPEAGIPQKVYDVLKYIRANNKAMPGYIGGRIFSNREELLPREDNQGKPVLYHEWDVNPKIAGQNRGAERIITGTDGRAWYTSDHYRSFKEIK